MQRIATLALLAATAAAGALRGAADDLAVESRALHASFSRAEQEAFLASAAIVSQELLDVGVTGSKRATLSDGRLTHDAHIQTVNERRTRYATSHAVYFNFNDSYRFNVAAYRVAALVGLERMVPVSVERRIGKERAAVTWWVDDVQMMELDRLHGGVIPPHLGDFTHQMRQARIFSQLIQNIDLNAGNLLITEDWKIWMVDFTRSFRVNKRLHDPDLLGPRIDAGFLEGMRRLDRATLTAELEHFLTRQEINTLLARRDRIVDFYDQAIAERGAGVMVCHDQH